MNIKIPLSFTTMGHRLANNSVKEHAHDYTELILVTQGDFVLQTPEKILIGKSGDLFVIPAHCLHYQPEKGYVGTSYIGFYHEPDDFDWSLRRVSLQNDIFTTRWFEDIIDLHNIIMDSQPFIEVSTWILKAIIARIKQIEQHQDTIKSVHPKLRKAIETIQKKVTKTISVEDIAAASNISSSYLTKLFRKNMGLSPIQYQQKLRMQLACKYLLNPYMTVRQTAQMCGYDNTSLFIRLFRKNYNLSPGQWRQKFAEK